MKKLEAAQWYHHIFDGDMTNFQSYYEKWKQWFDNRAFDYTTGFSLAPTTATNINSVPWPIPQEKGNNHMYIDDCVVTTPWPVKKCGVQPQAAAQSVIQVITDSKPDTAVSQRTFLERRVHDIKYTKYEEISTQFHRDEPDGPKTVAELKERLKKGLYTVALPKGYGSNFDEDEDEIYWRDAFSWRTPETQFDKDGYDAAYKELSIFIQDILDQIAILDPKDGLTLLDDLKKWKPSKAKK